MALMSFMKLEMLSFHLFTFSILIIICTCSNVDRLGIVSYGNLINSISKSSYTIVLLVQNDTMTEAESSLIKLKLELEEQLQCDIVKLTQSADFVKKYHLQKLPIILFFRQDKPLIYDGPFNVDDVIDWILQSTTKQVQILTDESFEHLTQAGTGATTGDWLVLFCNLTEQPCMSLQPIWDSVSSRISSRQNVAFVDTGKDVELVSRFKIKKTPEVIFFRLGKMYRYTNNKYDISFMTSFATKWYRNEKAERVPLLPSAFDNLIDGIVKKIRALVDDPVFFPAVVMLCLPVSIVLVAIYAKRRQKRGKKD